VDEVVDGVVNYADKCLTLLSYWRWKFGQFDALPSQCVGNTQLCPKEAGRSKIYWEQGKVSHSIESFLLRDEPSEVFHEERVSPVIFEVEAVLNTADEWVSAQEALLAAKQMSEETEAEREAVDIAGSRLVVAVARWRSRRRTN
jgi:hypothetical protein